MGLLDGILPPLVVAASVVSVVSVVAMEAEAEASEAPSAVVYTVVARVEVVMEAVELKD